MKTYFLNKDSWHYKAAEFGTAFGVPNETNICRYFWLVLRGALLFAVMTLSISVVASIIGISIANGIFHLLFDWQLLDISKAGLTVLFAVSATFSVVYAKSKFDRWMRTRSENVKEETESTFTSLAYAKFKDKTCFKILFK